VLANLKVAALTPNNLSNLLTWSPSGYYVDPRSVATAIAGDSTALASISTAMLDCWGG
jgi:hypothetical protein